MSDKEILDIKNEAFALYSTNNKEEALQMLNRIPQNRRDEDVFVIIGNICDDLGQRGVAIENFNKASQVSSKAYKAYYNIGCILLKKKSYELAQKNFKMSIKCNKDFPYAYYNLASCYIAQEQYSKAKGQLVKAISLKADDKDFYINLAYCYKMLGNDKAAQKIIDSLNKVKTST
ncbi:TPA: tetratricopeptide repeat protein [Candidatus Galligastranaerophilus intestinavium]|uniref:Tetratricopeptide repeat protein n=1 Tax=Candidatus Galligastranaerophilus intestinavium TaxID=2840836 RepID=A0A9D1FIA9_9BACT|nr:tetratricopeptide repeat protein [Candidatus Galligastranaerophilus intestinavium]